MTHHTKNGRDHERRSEHKGARSGGVSAAQAVRLAKAQLLELVGRQPETVSSVSQNRVDRATDELLERLLAAADAAANERVARLLAEAAAEAEAEVRHLVKSAMTAAMLRRAVTRLEGPSPTQQDQAQVAQEPPAAVEPAPARAQPPEGAPCYVYCVARQADLDGRVLQGIVGVDPAFAPRTVVDGALVAIVNSVSPDTFDDAAMAERVKDFEWVGTKVRAHDQVIKRAMEAGPVIPLRFGTVVRSEGDVLQLLGGHRQELTAALDRLDGKKEWGVKVRARTSELVRRARPTSDDESNDAGTGRTYLLERTRGDRARAEIRSAVRECVQDVHSQLAEIADDISLLPLSRPIAGETAEDEAELVLNGAYLVADAAAARFDALVTSLSHRYTPQGFEFELTGPWPAYNFVNVDLTTRESERE